MDHERFFAAIAIVCWFVPAVSAAGGTISTGACASGGDPAAELVFQGESRYGRSFVVDEEGVRVLRFGSPCGHDQSTLRLAEPSAVLAEYLRIATLGLALARRHERILMLGLGGGVWTNLVSRVLPGAHIAAVDIDPLVVWIAQRYFGVEVTERYRLHVADALDFARSARGRYDVVFVDLYTDEGTPAHLATREFFEAAGALLRPSGVLVANFGLGRAEAYLRSAGTLGDALGAVACVSAESEANLVAFAGTPDVLAVDAAVARSAELDGELDLGFALAPIAQRLRPCGR